MSHLLNEPCYFDRWGEKVFETTDSKLGWDGTYNGVAASTGVYMYFLKGTCRSNSAVVS